MISLLYFENDESERRKKRKGRRRNEEGGRKNERDPPDQIDTHHDVSNYISHLKTHSSHKPQHPIQHEPIEQQ
jgi:hypothetical protein